MKIHHLLASAALALQEEEESTLLSLTVEEESTLLAMRGGRVASTAESEASVGHLLEVASGRNMTQMQALVQNLVEESIQGDGVALDNDIQGALKLIKETLLGNIRSTLITEHKQDQDSIMRQLECFAKCNNLRDGDFKDCDANTQSYEILHQQHIACRTNLKAKYVSKVKACEELDLFVEKFELEDKPDEYCVYGAAYECHSEACNSAARCKPDLKKKFGAWLEKIIAQAEAGYESWYKLHVACKSAYHAYIKKDASCDVTQGEFESKVCADHNCRYLACQVDSTRCRAACITEYHAEVKRVECAEKDRKIDWSATEKIECYLKILLASPTDKELQEKCHDSGNCLSQWRTAEYAKCNAVCPEVDYDTGSYSNHERREAADGADGQNGAGNSGNADYDDFGDKDGLVNTTHRGDGENRCTSHLDIDFQPIPCAKPCPDPKPICDHNDVDDAGYTALEREWYLPADLFSSEVVDEASGVKTCYPSRGGQLKEHTKKWAYNACKCKHCGKPPGDISIVHDDYCEPEPEQPEVECPADVHATYKIPGKCFFTHCPSQNMNIDSARSWCQSKGGSLASIHTETENTKIYEMLAGRDAWIGAQRVSGNGAWTQGDWVWEDGTEWIRPTWPTDGLQSGTNSESRIAMYTDGKWHDWGHGAHARGVVCQVVAKPAVSYPSLTPRSVVQMIDRQTGQALTYVNGCAEPSDAGNQKWQLRTSSDGSAGLGQSSVWNGDQDQPLKTGATVAWFNVEAQRVSDCAWGACSSQPFPPPGGHWGTPYKIWKVNRDTHTIIDDQSDISTGDMVTFTRMWHNQFSDKMIQSCGTRGVHDAHTGGVLPSTPERFEVMLVPQNDVLES